MISQSKDWPNEVGSKGWGGDKDKELLLASFMHSGTNTSTQQLGYL